MSKFLRSLLIVVCAVMLGCISKPDYVQAATKKISTPKVTWNASHPGKVTWSKKSAAKSYTVRLYSDSKLLCTKIVRGKTNTDFCLQLAKNYKKANIFVKVRANAAGKSSNWGRTKKTFLNTKFKNSSRYNGCKNNWERLKVALSYNHPEYLKYLSTTTVTPTPTITPAPTATPTPTPVTGGYEVQDIRSAAPLFASNVLHAWTEMKFKLIVNPVVDFSGRFSVTKENSGSIVLKKLDENIYHELGHFLSFMTYGKAKKQFFVDIFQEEFPKFEGRNITYAGQNSDEYFAEAVYEYILNPERLKRNCPKTYETIEVAISEVTEERIKLFKKLYRVS